MGTSLSTGTFLITALITSLSMYFGFSIGTSWVTSSYFGKTVLNICDNRSGFDVIVYEPKKKELIIVGDENNSLLKKFNELINENKIRLESI